MPEPRHALTFDVEGSRSSAGSLVGFLALTFAMTWSFFITAAVLSGRLPAGAGLGPGLRVLVLLGTIAPSLVALALTRSAQGSEGLRALLSRIFRWRVSALFYVFAVGYMVAAKLMVALVHRFVTGAWPRFWGEAWYVMVAAIVISTWVQAGEEIGWRGYALPRLAARLGVARASIVLGVIWAVWHLPLFYLHGADTYGQSFVTYLLQVTAISVAMAWLYWRTHGSLFLVMLMHASINNTLGIVPTVLRTPGNPLWPSASLTSWLGVAALWTMAVFFLVRMRHAEIARPSEPDRS